MSHTNDLFSFEHWGQDFRGSSPCGEDVSCDADFESLQEEVRKDSSIHGGQKTDWVVVYGLANAILARSKDLWAFAYGTVAIYHSRSATDCIAVVHSLASLVRTQWPGLYPSLKRPQRRVAPLRWLCDRFAHIAASTAFLGMAPKDLAELNAAFAALQEAIDVHLLTNDLSFASLLREQMSAGHLTGPAEGSSSTGGAGGAKEGGPAETGASAGGAAQAQSPHLSSALDAIEKSASIPSAALPQVIRAANDYCRQLGDHLLTVNHCHEPGFLLHRVALWYTLPQLPPADAEGLTQMICPVVPDMIDMFTAAVNDKRHAEILPQLEKAASKAPFWLDGQHLVARCLEGLSAAEAACSVKHALGQLVRRFPDLTSLKFKDGRPFASPKTTAWIASFVPLLFGEHLFPAGGGAVPQAAQDEESLLLQGALALRDDAGFEAGLAALGAAHPGRNRAFLRQCLLRARYCIAAGRVQPAATLLQTIFDKLKDWDLLEWEPGLTTEVVSLLLKVQPKQQKQNAELSAVLHMVNLEAAIATTRG